jgi:hypothetical protein
MYYSLISPLNSFNLKIKSVYCGLRRDYGTNGNKRNKRKIFNSSYYIFDIKYLPFVPFISVCSVISPHFKIFPRIISPSSLVVTLLG